MLDAMGGAGGAYRWAKQTPALMARDLIHFTVPGYQRLAQSFAQDMGWNPAVFAHSPAPSSAD
jgi:lysophospholipase L1-like esterase